MTRSPTKQSVALVWKRWPNQCSESLHPFWQRRGKLTVEGGILFCRVHVIVPARLGVGYGSVVFWALRSS